MKTIFYKNPVLSLLPIIYLILTVTWFALIYPGREFPSENQINYQTGVLAIKELYNTKYHLLLYTNNGKVIEYSCMYSAFELSDLSSCTTKGKLDRYIGQNVKIGGYKQARFLGFDNTNLQMVTLENGNQSLISYEDTLNKILDLRKFLLFVYLIISVFFSIATFLFLKKLKSINIDEDN